MKAVTQDHVDLAIPVGATLVAGPPAGATFRVWAPAARAVYLNGTFGGVDAWSKDADPRFALERIAGSDWWGGFAPCARDGDAYKFYVVGTGSAGFKRDPYARERQAGGNGILREPGAYPWHDAGFVPPAFNDMVIYQLHVGSFFRHAGAGEGCFLDVVEKIPYLRALGVNVLQLLPVNEFETPISEGYNGSDYFAPEHRYGAADPTAPVDYLAIANGLLAELNCPPLAPEALSGPAAQLKLLVDLCHLNGIAVHFDVVYNHAGGFDGDDETLFFWDRRPPGDNNDSQYFIDGGQMGPGGLPFALWKREVQAFLIDHARSLVTEFHADGLRYDEVSLLCAKNAEHGWPFCQAVTSTLRFVKPSAFHNAEFWPVDTATTVPAAAGGAGFDGTQNDGLREALRDAVAQAAQGRDAAVDLRRVADQLAVPGFPARWKAVQCVENHDKVYRGNGPRIPRLADGSDSRSWYARSRSRVALGLLMTAPGIPQLFMGQEFLEDRQWSDDPDAPLHISWDGLAGQKPMADFLRYSRDLIGLRGRLPALRGEAIRVLLVDDGRRVVAFHRWREGSGDDVVVVATLSEASLHGYRIGFPGQGRWSEAFNADVYDDWVNPSVVGNGGGVDASASPLHGFAFSAALEIPANGVLVFTR